MSAIPKTLLAAPEKPGRLLPVDFFKPLLQNELGHLRVASCK
jgi:hypothetical protein